ncbi:MAG: hypothetical protein ABFR02_03145 [Campylobacterota bacterium]
MKKLSFVISFLLFSQLALFATTPYNLEGFKALNVTVLDRSATISTQLTKRLASELKSKLEKSGIESKKDGVGVLFVKTTSANMNYLTEEFLA